MDPYALPVLRHNRVNRLLGYGQVNPKFLSQSVRNFIYLFYFLLRTSASSPIDQAANDKECRLHNPISTEVMRLINNYKKTGTSRPENRWLNHSTKPKERIL